MDAYLESLIKKEQIEKSASEESSVQPVSEAPEEKVESVAVENRTVTISTPEIVAEATETLAPEKVQEPVTEPEISKYKEGDVIYVKNLKVYNTPDTRQITKSITGNVEYVGKICDFTIIRYVRHGFGTVKGYTLESLE